MSSSELDPILDDLAAGRIDSAEAARRIEQVRGAADGPAGEPRRARSAAWSGTVPPDEEDLRPRPEAEPTDDRASDAAAGDRTSDAEPAGDRASDAEPVVEQRSEEELGRAQRPGLAREDFSQPSPEEPAGETENQPDDDQQSPEQHAAGEQTGTGRAGAEQSWFDLARQGFDRLRHEAEEGLGRLRHEAETRFSERPAGAGADEFTRPAPRGPGARPGGVRRVSIRVVGRRVRVLGDPGVTTAEVDGQHVLRRSGDVVEIISEGDVGPSMQGFSLFRPPRSFDDVKSMGLGKELVVRINPELVLDAEVTGGSLRTESIDLLGKVRVTVGGARLIGIAEAEDVLIQAGPGTVTGTITTGRSRVRCESGSLTVALGADSNVTVHAESQLGRVGWAGEHTGAADEVVLGNGAARLDVAIVMGAATIRTGSTAEEHN
ncbi:hypothetical protein GGQ54_002392 [Naumannella cuiyingiana]|uniref:Adhesin domain-containing protein n=1 Tax=Naumannella cuiyingiana TaxID=1347891 RepID=A0A7Z0DAK5_9ACTN|nr:hypothetical protein [Naumannella cuiyingiana]NYI71832.1 hypothetical protein [Naumannella cuiyingiana]